MKKHRTHSDTFKEKVVNAANSGLKHTDVSKKFKVHGSLITRWKKEFGNSKKPLPFPNPEPVCPIEPEVEPSEVELLRQEIYALKIENTVLKRLVVEIAQNI